jgi:hypothetical protein
MCGSICRKMRWTHLFRGWKCSGTGWGSALGGIQAQMDSDLRDMKPKQPGILSYG